MNDLDIKEYIEKSFGLTVLDIKPTIAGSGNTFDVITHRGRYLVKGRERSDFLSVYRKACPVLEEAGFKQSQIAYSDEKLTMYQWLEGETSKTLTPEKTAKAIRYMKRYFKALKRIPIDEIGIKRINAWDDAKSVSFLIDVFPQMIQSRTVPCVTAAIAGLSKARGILEELPKQLIHSDLGPDNFLFIGDEVNAIIDFTPEIASDIYGLCQFLYWNVLWKEETMSSLHKWAVVYSSQLDREVFHLLMVQAALFRVVGPILNGDTNLDKRIALLEELL